MRDDKRFQNALTELRSQASDEGMDQAANSFQFDPKVHRRRPWLIAASLAGAACSIMGGLVLFTPKAQAFGLEDIQLALKSVPASYSRSYMGGPQKSGKSLPSMEMWQEGIKRRYRWGLASFDRGFDGENVWVIRKPEKIAVISKELPDGFGFNGTDLNSQLESLRQDKRYKLSASRAERSVDGRKTLVVTVIVRNVKSDAPVYKHIHYCDPMTKLPFRSEYYGMGRNKDMLNSVTLIDYPKDLPDSVFAFAPPDGYSILDHRKAIRSIESGLQGAGQTKTVEGVTIKLLGALQERDGTVTVLWTGGGMPNVDAVAGAFDEKGVGYGVAFWYENDDRNRPRNYGKPADTAVSASSGKKPAAPPKDFHGSSAEKPVVLRPMAWYGTTPIYGMKVTTEYQSPNRPRTLKVTLPACEAEPHRVLRLGDKGVYFQADGAQVGQATFDVETIPVNRYFEIVSLFDKNTMRNYGLLPIKGINVDKERDLKFRQENFLRDMQETNSAWQVTEKAVSGKG